MDGKKQEAYKNKIGIIVIISLFAGIILGVFSPVLYDHVDQTVGFISLIVSFFCLMISFFFMFKFSLESRSAKIGLCLGALFFLSLILGFNVFLMFGYSSFEVLILYLISLGVLIFVLLVISERTTIKTRRIPVSDYKGEDFTSENVLDEFLENKIPEDMKKILINASKMYLIATLALYIVLAFFLIYVFFTLKLNSFIYMLVFCIFIALITTAYFVPRRRFIEKNIDSFRRKIIITDKEIQIPFWQSLKFLGKAIFMRIIDLGWNPVGMMASQNSAYIRYKDIEKCYFNFEEGTIEIVTKNFPIKLYLNEGDIKRIMEYIKKYSEQI